MADGTLSGPDGRPARIVHVVAELAPFARSGGLGEAVNSLARYQSAPPGGNGAGGGMWTAIIMPLYDLARLNAPRIEPVGAAFTVTVGPRQETVRLWKLVSDPGDALAGIHVYF